MALSKHSLFFYGFRTTASAFMLDFKEGVGAEISVSLDIKGYVLEDLATAIQTAFNQAGALNYLVSVDRATRILTIGADGAFTLLAATGSNVGSGVWALIGFPATDVTGTSLSGTNPIGAVYAPQFILQDYLSPENNRRALSAVVSKSASGKKVTVQSFGEEKLVRMNIKYITDIPQPENFRLRNNVNGVEDANTFFNFIVEKDLFQFMPDETKPEVFYNVLLETIGNSQDGTGYDLKEYTDQNLPGYFESGPMVLKVIED